MKYLINLSFICFLFSGCNSYENKSIYKIRKGEQVNIYYSTNSCCYYCLFNNSELKHTQLKDKITIDPGPDDCAGCNYIAAFVFEGTSPGTDTIKLKRLGATMNCDSTDVEQERYIIQVY